MQIKNIFLVLAFGASTIFAQTYNEADCNAVKKTCEKAAYKQHLGADYLHACKRGAACMNKGGGPCRPAQGQVCGKCC
ncbi:unnamed protein product [Zymoseptoria tritici ST99CH_1A5]|uniref:Uncharacterized protein n=2 Tax=Zymoseptoria tritici TaxID=1047171 RepID=A0A1X7S5Y8_ZYMT9|nr:unnamed protein product [Zymoseptoria tritici ST99CH_3D7]SMY28768.1 unnamed protein product [Zymoseptoria tritici ST99CH_1A5]